VVQGRSAIARQAETIRAIIDTNLFIMSGSRPPSRPRRRDASIRRQVAEALASITDDDKVHELIVDMALAEAGSQVDLSNPAQFGMFVDGPLCTAIEQLLGGEAAQQVRAILDPELTPDDLEESGVMPRASTVPAPAWRRALVVTCHAAGGLAIQRLLESHGYVARCVADATEAIAVCAGSVPDVILADLDWLDLEGRELLGQLGEALGAAVPPVLLIGRRTEAVEGAALSLPKPLDRDRLIAALDELMVSSRTPEASGDVASPIEDESTYDDGSIAQLVCEALDQIASPEVRDAVFVDALERAGLDDWPEMVDEIAQFVVGPLHASLLHRLGEEVAEQVIVELEPFLRHVDVRIRSGVRRKDRRRCETQPPSKRVAPTVLLVDDDESFLHALSRSLRERGFHVLYTSDAHSALALCASAQPQLVVADLHMPAMSGRQLAALMQLTLDDDAPPIVILTADSHAPPKMDWVACVLHKPIDPDELVAVIEAHALPASRATG
jgi:DNA-binding response OmpR family regulator